MKTVKYFSATWCGPCQTFKPIMNEISNEGHSVQFIDIDQQEDLARQYNVRSVPTIVIEQGEAIDTDNPETPSFYFVIKGEVSVIKDGKWVCNLQRGDYFGEIASLGANFRTATVKTNNQDCSFLTISAKNLNDILSHNLALAIALETIADHRAEDHLSEDNKSGVEFEKEPSIVTESSFVEKHAFFEEQNHFDGIDDIKAEDLSLFDFNVQQLDEDKED